MKEGRHNKYVGKEMNIQLPVVIMKSAAAALGEKDQGDRMVIVSIVVIVSQA